MEELKFAQKIAILAYKKFVKDKDNTAKMKENANYIGDVVTQCDLDVENFLIEEIKKKYPNDTIVSEEFNSKEKRVGRCWIIDPIDGTVNFKNNIPIWCIQIAFCEGEQTKGALVYVPTENKFYSADENGFYINGKPAKTSSFLKPNQSLVGMSDIVQNNDEVFPIQFGLIEKLSKVVMRVRCYGSAGYEFSAVASGRLQGYIMVNPNIWDCAMGMFLCEKAGRFNLVVKNKNLYVYGAFATEELKNLVQKCIKTILKELKKVGE